MSKRIALPAAIKAIREARAGYDAKNRTYSGDPTFAVSIFATRCLMSPAHLCNIEKGTKRPSPDVLARIADGLGVSLDAISYELPDEAAA